MYAREKNDTKGEVAEWSKAHAWKVCELQKGSAGSNPAFSANSNIKLIIHEQPNIKNSNNLSNHLITKIL